MKICILAVPTANLDDVYLTLEGINYNLKDIMPICNKVNILSAAAGDATWLVYVDIPMTVQAVGNGGGAGTFRVLTDSDPNWVKNLQASTVAQFKKGRSYLLRAIDGPLTNILPQPMSCAAAINTGVATGVYTSIRYLFTADQDMNPIGATTADVITFDVDLAIMQQVKAAKRAKRIAEGQNAIAGNVASGQSNTSSAVMIENRG